MDNCTAAEAETTPSQHIVHSPLVSSRKHATLSIDRLKNAKFIADQAIKNHKIFTIQGPYPAIRESLRSRGWVEKFYSTSPVQAAKPSPPAKKPKTSNKTSTDESDDNDDDDDDADDNCDGDGNQIDLNDFGGAIPPWEEENGFYGVTSRLVKNASPTFIFGVRRDVVDPKSLTKDQMINHFGHACFTTKVGLCTHLRNLPWYEQADCNVFFPRCYRLSHDEDKEEFIDDFCLTASVSLLKHINNNDAVESHRKDVPMIPKDAIKFALLQCEKYLQGLVHEDIDKPYQEVMEKDFDNFIGWYYQVIHNGGEVEGAAQFMPEIGSTLYKMRGECPQYEIDGTKNVWIVKPGAKSRGRGIQCYNRLDDMLKLVTSQVAKKEGKYIVQKYIETPLLIHRTKFDVRQWFLVTDWNPFTLWFYRESYLRFCSQEFTLDCLDEAIHLSNNSIQKNYKNGERASELPDDNMWSHHEFIQYLQKRGDGHVWNDIIYPGMKKAVTSALLCCQDDVEHRKGTFELYGADFMFTEDYNPWLIEINSSPCMAPSTKVTARMCSQVLEDTIKVVLDRKCDKNADVGLFELAYKQPQFVIPQYIGMNLQVDGSALKNPGFPTTTAKKCLGDQLVEPIDGNLAIDDRKTNDEILKVRGEISNVKSEILNVKSEILNVKGEILNVKGENCLKKDVETFGAGIRSANVEISRAVSRSSDDDRCDKAPIKTHEESKGSNGAAQNRPNHKRTVAARNRRNAWNVRPTRNGATDDAVRDTNVAGDAVKEASSSTNADNVTASYKRSGTTIQVQASKRNVYNRKCGRIVGGVGGGEESKEILSSGDDRSQPIVESAPTFNDSNSATASDGSNVCVPSSNVCVPSNRNDPKNAKRSSPNHAGKYFLARDATTGTNKKSTTTAAACEDVVLAASSKNLRETIKPVNISCDVTTRSVTEYPIVFRNCDSFQLFSTGKMSRKAPTSEVNNSGKWAVRSSNQGPNIVNVQPYITTKPVPAVAPASRKAPNPPTTSVDPPSDSWHNRAASLYEKTKRGQSNGAHQKFLLRYTNAGIERASLPHRFPQGLPSLVSQYLERNYREGRHESIRVDLVPSKHAPPLLSITTRTFPFNW